MKKYLVLFIISTVFLASGCSNASDSATNSENVAQEQKAPKQFSPEDQKIIDKYNAYFGANRAVDDHLFQKQMKEILPEIGKISDKHEREKLQMNIYLSLEKYEDAYALNESQLAENPNSITRLIFKCHLLSQLGKGKDQVSQCHNTAAKQIKIELDKTDKSSPDYAQAEFTYYAQMYKAGHVEYKYKAQNLISSTKDIKLKTWFASVYNAEIEDLYEPGSAGIPIK
ncbi:hypothetical protein F971_02008 [Acinetobacter vivianii]|uniref:Lipoprotein n=1 Tax=Acinetobacter vivianii TaxID=1776742 RepID=N8UX07_9GAMM|nr:hypothetical protein [Acinetobacter vivianii]ENU92121.1 hypothetical protein F971_02008 [Acinetobacter vivianii]